MGILINACSILSRAVDKSLLCVATETSSCDLLSKAQIAGAMMNLIDTYTGPDYSCTLGRLEPIPKP